MIKHESEIKKSPVYADGANEVSKQILAGPRDGFPGFLREFSLAAGGYTPYHHHGWYHLVYILEGSGLFKYEGREYPVKKGAVAYIEAHKEHGFTNTGDQEMSFLCLVPGEGDEYPGDE